MTTQKGKKICCYYRKHNLTTGTIRLVHTFQSINHAAKEQPILLCSVEVKVSLKVSPNLLYYCVCVCVCRLWSFFVWCSNCKGHTLHSPTVHCVCVFVPFIIMCLTVCKGTIINRQRYFLSIFYQLRCYTFSQSVPSTDQVSPTVCGAVSSLLMSSLSSLSSACYQQIYSSLDCSKPIKSEITNSQQVAKFR